jgi:hypothetical protein
MECRTCGLFVPEDVILNPERQDGDERKCGEVGGVMRVEDTSTKKDTDFAQRVAYVYKAKREINGSRVRVIWG